MIRVIRRIPNWTGGWVLVCEDGTVQFDLYGSRTVYVVVGDLYRVAAVMDDI